MPKELVEVTPRNDVAITRSVSGPPTDLAASIGGVLESVTAAIASMRPDDIDVSVDASSNVNGSRAVIRMRGYKRREGQ
jgi:hypothetical protein